MAALTVSHHPHSPLQQNIGLYRDQWHQSVSVWRFLVPHSWPWQREVVWSVWKQSVASHLIPLNLRVTRCGDRSEAGDVLMVGGMHCDSSEAVGTAVWGGSAGLVTAGEREAHILTQSLNRAVGSNTDLACANIVTTQNKSILNYFSVSQFYIESKNLAIDVRVMRWWCGTSTFCKNLYKYRL